VSKGSRIAVVAALEREVRGLVKNWSVTEKELGGRGFRFFENGDLVVVCGGIGAVAARRAAEPVIATYAPRAIYSAGFAGGLDPALNVADIVQPRRVVNASDGSSVDLGRGEGVLVSFGAVANPEQKARLRDSFGGQAVDMEAAAVARAAEARGVNFAVVKVISDEFDFNFPSTERFVDASGQFREGRFVWFAILRPWLWPQVAQLARNSRCASQALCGWLGKMKAEPIAATSGTSDLEEVNRR
jgi:adenosylhomocysteine nucleosidase